MSSDGLTLDQRPVPATATDSPPGKYELANFPVRGWPLGGSPWIGMDLFFTATLLTHDLKLSKVIPNPNRKAGCHGRPNLESTRVAEAC
jgi:hypothetical protein